MIKPVEVIWEDAHGAHGWKTLEDADRPAIIRSSGYIVKKNKKCLILASGIHLEQDDDDCFLDYIYIPKAMVRKIRKLY